jgi:cytochrome c peroxidase
VLVVVVAVLAPRSPWTDAEMATLRSLSLISLGPVPADPSNRFANDARAVAFGQRLFFDTRFSSNGKVSCSTCHQPLLGFTDGLPLGQGVALMNRNTMPIVGTQYGQWLFWDGRKDSLWAQALGPLESSIEHNGSRGQYAHLIAAFYRAEYEALFGKLPPLEDTRRFPLAAGPVLDPAARAAWEGMSPADRDALTQVYVNMGKAIAAYERALLPGETRFDRYVRGGAISGLTEEEIAGLRLFLTTGHCINCHNGPLLSNGQFHNTGVPLGKPGPDTGRSAGAASVLADEFNCLSRWSDAKPEDCGTLRFLKAGGDQLIGSFKVPSLRGVAERVTYMHAGQFRTLEDVVRNYSNAPAAKVGTSELRPLGLTSEETAQIVAFLKTLSGPPNAPPELLRAP